MVLQLIGSHIENMDNNMIGIDDGVSSHSILLSVIIIQYDHFMITPITL